MHRLRVCLVVSKNSSAVRDEFASFVPIVHMTGSIKKNTAQIKLLVLFLLSQKNQAKEVEEKERKKNKDRQITMKYQK